MKLSFAKLALCICCVLVAAVPALHAASPVQPSGHVTTAIERMMQALAKGHLASFVEGSTEEFRTAMTEAQMRQLTEVLAPRMAKGYEVQWLGALRRQGQLMHLYKLSFADKGDDLMVRLVMQDETVSGFWLQ